MTHVTQVGATARTECPCRPVCTREAGHICRRRMTVLRQRAYGFQGREMNRMTGIVPSTSTARGGCSRHQVPFNPPDGTDKPALDNGAGYLKRLAAWFNCSQAGQNYLAAGITVVDVDNRYSRHNLLGSGNRSLDGAGNSRPVFPCRNVDGVPDGFAIAAAGQSNGFLWEERHCEKLFERDRENGWRGLKPWSFL